MPDNAWALDARDGHEIWHYYWKTRGGTHIANRGLGMWNNYLYMETPDNYLVSLDARTGKERWHKVIADFSLQYFSTTAPIVVGNHVIVGTGNDLDSPGFLQSFDPETGELQWKFYTVPMNPGDPGLDTWPSLDAARHGGAQPWLPGAYDPETKLYIFGTGNPTPAYTPGRGEGDNLFTCSLVAVNVDTGKMAWYFQTSPHDMHDWDSAQTPILIDGVIDGKKTEARLDRGAQRLLLHPRPRDRRAHRLEQVRPGDELGQERRAERLAETESREGRVGRRRARVSDRRRHDQLGAARLLPGYGTLLCLREKWLLDLLSDRSRSARLDGAWRPGAGQCRIGRELPDRDRLQDRERSPGGVRIPARGGGGGGGGGLLTTAGGLVFAGDAGGNIVAYDSTTGVPLWHSHIGNVTAPPQTYLLDGRQYLLVAIGDKLYAFTLY